MRLFSSIIRALASPDGRVVLDRGVKLVELVLRDEAKLKSLETVQKEQERRLRKLEASERQRSHVDRAVKAQLDRAHQANSQAARMIQAIQDAWIDGSHQADLDDLLDDYPLELEIEAEDDLEPTAGDGTPH